MSGLPKTALLSTDLSYKGVLETAPATKLIRKLIKGVVEEGLKPEYLLQAWEGFLVWVSTDVDNRVRTPSNHILSQVGPLFVV